MKGWRLRPLDTGVDDRRFLAAMLYEAAAWRPGPRPAPAEVLAEPANARYVAGWGRAGDFGLVAVAEDGERLGAAWYRLFSATEPGYGFVDEETPEVSIAVRPGSRRRGIGTALLGELSAHAAQAGFSALSLSVEVDNPAGRLYRRLGFEPVEDGGDPAPVLVLRLEPSSAQRPSR